MTTALVSGAGSGIGRATALMLAQRGLEVVCVGRTRETLDATVKSITDTGGKAQTVVADRASQSVIMQVAHHLRGHSVLALVHAAGRNMAKAFADISPDELSELPQVRNSASPAAPSASRCNGARTDATR